MAEKQCEISAVYASEEESGVVPFMAERSGLSKGRIKDAMLKGALWLQRGKARPQRLRRAKTQLRRGDRVELFYDAVILAIAPPPPQCRWEGAGYSVWFKPPGLLTQGTKYGDHCSLLRQAGLHLGSGEQVYPVHRLDREAGGLAIVAHDRQMAAALSELFQERQVEKQYQAEVLGILGEKGATGSITEPLDGKSALTTYEVLDVDPVSQKTLVDVHITTGRKHQIRRHFALLSAPVLGDPIYGTGNKNMAGLRLVAYELSFHCPEQDRVRTFSLEPPFFGGP